MPPKRANEPSRPRWRKRQRAHRSGAQTQQDRGAQLAARIDFNGVWKELKAAGWTPKVSRGLDKEEAVLRHYVDHVAHVPLESVQVQNIPERALNGKQPAQKQTAPERVNRELMVDKKDDVLLNKRPNAADVGSVAYAVVDTYKTNEMGIVRSDVHAKTVVPLISVR
ncbi:hypothetical protein PInf_018305 [Phytophthora infestans]|nr:hypothetical protein PInf_018305 [Phytophthora infestans]